MVVVKTRLTALEAEEAVLCGRLPADGSWELVEGEVVPVMPTEGYHGEVCVEIISVLRPVARQIGAKMFDGQTGFIVGGEREQVRMPDVSLVTRERLHIVPTRGFVRGAPDLAVEVLSEGQFGEAYALAKISEYFAAGGKLVLLVDPRAQTVRAYEAGSQTYSEYSGNAELTLDAIAPGFKARVSAFFP